ncbi:hypothetical protein [Klebsiella pneumoniae]|uniref:hypothetical protein n=1 Tax=Klebsiella pneumoniae TaxID=573 RepID=UPI002119770A|nr:hypothetical protein [Klebsiella pneumoniae]MCQ8701607.1 hypothetical protein [Klebsiella pneumoniae]
MNNELTAALLTIEKCRELSGCPAGVDLQDWVKQLAAESLALKAGVTYFAYSPEYGFDYFKDKQSAIDTAQTEIDAYREDADDGWSEDVQHVSWGIVIQQAQGIDAKGKHTSHSQHTYQTCDYRLVDSVSTPATDRIVAGIKADGALQYAENLDSAADDAERNGYDDAVKFLRSEASAVRLFAAQLREGADK